MKKVIDLSAARKAAEKKKYSALVLETFDRFEHDAKKRQREQAAEVRRKARNTL